jgi:hypothetical protein
VTLGLRHPRPGHAARRRCETAIGRKCYLSFHHGFQTHHPYQGTYQ